MTKRWTRSITVMLLCLGLSVLVAACGGNGSDAGAIFVNLSGGEEVPAVQTAGSGTAEIRIDDAAMEIAVTVDVEGIPADQLLMAHFHAAPAGANGPVVAFLLASTPPDTSFSAIVTPDDVLANEDAGIANFDDLVQAIRDGGIYVNVHTPTNPLGEIRGQTG